MRDPDQAIAAETMAAKGTTTRTVTAQTTLAGERTREVNRRRGWRAQRAAVVLAACALAIGGCGSDANDVSTPNSTTSSPTGPATTTSDVEKDDAEPASPLTGFSGELVITRQRDLIDRGLINVLTTNGTGHDLVVTDRQLVADHYDTTAAQPRTSTLRDGRNVALQVPYGTATDCTTTSPVTAQLRLTYTVAGSDTERTAAVDIGGADILDAIRAKQCAALDFDASTEVTLEDVTIDNGAVTATVTISRTSGESSYAIERMSGTILVGADAPDDDQTIVVDGSAPVDVPVRFVVNQCDPHALAELTKRYGLDFDISIDDQPAQPVPIDISVLVPELEATVEQCRSGAS